MKTLIFIFLMIGSAGASASEKYSLTLGKEGRETLTLAAGRIQNQEVFTLAYRSASGKRLLKVIPRDLFNEKKKEFQSLYSNFHQVRTLAGFACSQFAEMSANSKHQRVCLDSALPADQKQLGQWFQQGLNLAK